ncbi:MAG: SIS domain-containing protein [Anaerolineaceae bacterium]|nr:SIS domain-containing protein [Anaerolineaceae bacterium]
MKTLPPYIKDILCQPEDIQKLLDTYEADALESIKDDLVEGKFDRIILSGMGSSLNALYPASLSLAALDLPVIWMDTSELLHYAVNQINERSLVWLVSQSGQSAEILTLLDVMKKKAPKAKIIASTNEPDSPLAKAAHAVLLIRAGDEYTVSTRTYLNTLITNMFGVEYLKGKKIAKTKEAIQNIIPEISAYVQNWQEHVQSWKEQLYLPGKFFLLGRGPSMAAVMTGALTTKEAAKWQLEGITTAHFRHGPLEMADENLTAIILSGCEKTKDLNRNLALDIKKYGGKVIWINQETDLIIPTMTYPAAPDALLQLVEILPIQMLTIALAEQNGFEPGEFRYLGKITTTE